MTNEDKQEIAKYMGCQYDDDAGLYFYDNEDEGEVDIFKFDKAPKMRVIENQYIINRKVIMLKTGHSLGSLAEHVGHTKQAVSQAIQGRSTSLRIHRKIAEVLNVRLVDFWPELYGEPTTTTTTTQGGDIRVG